MHSSHSAFSLTNSAELQSTQRVTCVILDLGLHCVCRTHLSSLLDFLLLSIPLLHVPHEQPLTQELLGSARGLNVQKGIVGIFDHALPKGTNAKLYHGSVVQDLNETKMFVLM